MRMSWCARRPGSSRCASRCRASDGPQSPPPLERQRDHDAVMADARTSAESPMHLTSRCLPSARSRRMWLTRFEVSRVDGVRVRMGMVLMVNISKIPARAGFAGGSRV
ncbi:hypothetical protein BN10_720021 [Phycicoccus elongatus Lp2]|uniref:Uncharacterized protein n=1 Tax=Phycicoccus elongatus Lp2 TaxID=1193181 RepID=N0E224_9MICO|nr:hypothetical protein BN10_720021 [Phycicoccus elongatus Lp2]